jgi:hypothetical protein
VLYDLPTPLIVGGLLFVMLTAAEVARQAGARHVPAWPQTHDALLNVTSAMLLLLGLMLAFSFSMSVGRFQARQAALLAEANAVIAVDLLADLLLPEPRLAVLADLREFTDQRIAFLTVGHDRPRERAAAQASHLAAERIWRVVTSAGSYREPAGQSLSLLGRAVLEMVTAARAREAARSTLVPQPLLVMLFVLALLASTMVSFNFRAAGLRSRALTVTFMLLVCMIIYVVIDLDRPRRGIMRLDPAPLALALDGIEAEPVIDAAD